MMNFEPAIHSHASQTLEEQILVWMEELARDGKPAHGSAVACQLSTALERFMGIERELLMPLMLSPKPY
jgi:hypothetical protein